MDLGHDKNELLFMKVREQASNDLLFLDDPALPHHFQLPLPFLDSLLQIIAIDILLLGKDLTMFNKLLRKAN